MKSMKSVKKMCSLLLAAALLLGFVSAAHAETIKITFWHSMSENAGALIEGYVKRFNETIGREQGIEVEAVFQGQYAEAMAKMNSVLSGKQYDVLPDVMQMDATGKVSFAAAQTAYPIDAALRDHPETDLSVFLAPALANWQLSGVQLGLPFATSTTVLYYNKTALDAAGFGAPETLEDIGALSALASDGTAVYASIPNTPLLANWLGQLGSDLVNQRNGAEGSATALACEENGALAEFLTAWKNLYASGALVNQNSSGDEFAAGRQLLMTESTSKVASTMKKIDGRFELGVAPYPKVSASSAAGATVSGSCLVMFDHGDERKNAAWTFVQFLTSAEIQADFAANTGYLPANREAAESAEWQDLVKAYPQYQVGLDQLANTPDTMRSVTVGPAADFYYAIINDVSDMLENDLTVEETVELMVDDLGGMLTQYALANP